MSSRRMNLDAAKTIELCESLVSYGEAGALSRDLMTQVGSHALAVHGRDIEVVMALGRMLLSAHQLTEAEPTLTLATSLAPDDPRGFRLLGEALLLLGRTSAAQEAIERAIALGMKDADTLDLRDRAGGSGPHKRPTPPESGRRAATSPSGVARAEERRATDRSARDAWRKTTMPSAGVGDREGIAPPREEPDSSRRGPSPLPREERTTTKKSVEIDDELPLVRSSTPYRSVASIPRSVRRPPPSSVEVVDASRRDDAAARRDLAPRSSSAPAPITSRPPIARTDDEPDPRMDREPSSRRDREPASRRDREPTSRRRDERAVPFELAATIAIDAPAAPRTVESAPPPPLPIPTPSPPPLPRSAIPAPAPSSPSSSPGPAPAIPPAAPSSPTSDAVDEASTDSHRGETTPARGPGLRKLKFLDPGDELRRLDRYELIGEIASGGMATVFLARLAGAGGFQRFYAIKRLHSHLADDDEFVQMFLDEARLAAGIHDPHVVPILEVGTTGGGYYLVMDYVEGCTLARLCSRTRAAERQIPSAIALRLLLDVLAGLHAAHELTDGDGRHLRLVHRDCTPQNILVGADGCARLTDFGVASAAARLSVTHAKTVKGTLAYLSPEQAKADPIDGRSDLFAAGVILWELLAGRRLFRAETEAKTLARLLLEPIPDLRTAAPQVHPALEDVCRKALQRDAAERYQTANEMAEAIERAVQEAAAAGAEQRSIGSARDVAAYLIDLFGPDLAQQREGVRAWISLAGEDAPPLSLRADGLTARSTGRFDVPATPLDAPAAPPSADATVPSMASGPHPVALAAPPSKPAARSALVLALLILAGAIFAIALVGFLYLRYQESRAGRSHTPGLAEPVGR